MEVARGHLESKLLIPQSRRDPVLASTVQAGQIDVLVFMCRNARTDLRRRLAELCHAVGIHTLLRAGAALHAMRAREAALQAGVAKGPVAAAVAG